MVVHRIGQVCEKKAIANIRLIRRSMASLSGVEVTKNFSSEQYHAKSNGQSSIQAPVLTGFKNPTSLVDSLLETTSSMMDPNGSNVIAYSGGVDSSLVAALVQQVYTSSLSKTTTSFNSTNGNTTAILGVSPAVPSTQIDLARHIARDIIRIDLLEIPTSEGSDPMYIQNKGQACLACKTNLYSTLESVANHAISSKNGKSLSLLSNNNVILFNGTNQNDTTDPTRLGLIAANNFHVRSPLSHISKDEVRIAAKHLGLPNWNYAASPCLRSRLALGVEATQQHLKMVEEGETFVRNVLGLSHERNLRVRLLSGGRAGVELDESMLDGLKEILMQAGFRDFLQEKGFTNGEFVIREFKSGGVAGAPLDAGQKLVENMALKVA